MNRMVIAIKKFAILCHRWMGVAFSLLFMWWFISGLFMMYWSYPEIEETHRLEHAPVLDPARVVLSPQEALKKAGVDSAPEGLRLISFDSRPAYEFRIGRGTALIYAHLGAIPHWLYYTPIRINSKFWTQLVIWLSGIATIATTLGMIVGIWMLSPNKKYRHEGQPSAVPYTGQKRLHTILGLFFGILTMTWAFSGMMSMDPFPIQSGGPALRNDAGSAPPAQRIQRALARGDFDLAAYSTHPRDVLAKLGPRTAVKELDYTFFASEPVIHVKNSTGIVGVLPAKPTADLTSDRLRALIRETVGPEQIADLHWMTEYDRYYLDRTRTRPLPVIYVQLKDEGETRLYIDPKTARVAGRYTNTTSAWVTRWLYHGLHSLDFPWLYNHRPAWDIVVGSLMLACVWLCWTSIMLSWRVLKRKFAPRRRHEVDDLAV